MKLKTLLLSILGGSMMLTACSGPGEGRPLEDIKNASTTDSISNLLGQMYAIDYWKDIAGDSVKATREARDQYLSGVRDALKLSGKDESYIEGYLLGLQLSQYSREFTNLMGVDIDLNETLKGLAYGLRTDSTVNYQQVSADLNLLTTRFANQKDEKDRAEGEKNLAAFAKKEGMTKYSEDLYGKILSQGTGKELKEGENVSFDIVISDDTGKKLNIPVPKDVTVGPQLSKAPIGRALMQLKEGGAGEFATSAFAVFGANAGRYKVTPEQTLVMNITLKGISQKAAEAEKSEPKVQPAETTAN